MSIAPNGTTPQAQNQAIRHGDRRHAASIAKQRKNAVSDPRSRAEAIYRIISKRVADGQPLPDLSRYGVTDDIWAELIFLLSGPELEAVKAAYGDEDEEEPTVDDLIILDVAPDHSRGDTDGNVADVPPVEPPVEVPEVAHERQPTWRDREPAIVHSLKWRDSEGIEHLHVVHADTIDEALVHIRTVKVVIAAAKAKAKQEPQASQTPHVHPDNNQPSWCRIHNVEMAQRSNAKGSWYSHALPNGAGFCKGK
jgi:hypothetical protein